jgi:hypothetical protein
MISIQQINTIACETRTNWSMRVRIEGGDKIMEALNLRMRC